MVDPPSSSPATPLSPPGDPASPPSPAHPAPPATPDRRDPLDPLLAVWLRSGPATCPRCRYDVTAAVRPACPECGLALVLRVEPAVPVTLPFALVLTVLALVPGFGLLYLVGSVSYATFHGQPVRDDPEIRRFLGTAAVSAIPLVLWILARRRLVRLTPPVRRGVIVVFLVLGVLGAAGIMQTVGQL